MKRFIDKPKYSFSDFKSDLHVKCPKCGGFGVLSAQSQYQVLRCEKCHPMYRKPKGYLIRVRGLCPRCNNHYRVDYRRAENYMHAEMWVTCPHCQAKVKGAVARREQSAMANRNRRSGCDPYWGCELYFRAEFRGKLVWAYNREHLAYLIDYLEAKLREKPRAFGYIVRTQSDKLPRFMKSAKNREAIVRLLKKLQSK